MATGWAVWPRPAIAPAQNLSFASTNIQLSNTQPVMGTNTFGNIAITRKNVVLNGTTTMLLFGGITTTYGTGTSTSNINTSISAAQTFTVATGAPSSKPETWD